jgi:hypothetical protein
MHKTRGNETWIKDKVETGALNATKYKFKYCYTSRSLSLCHIVQAHYDIVLCHLLWPGVYINHNTMCTTHDNTTCIVHTRRNHTINSNMAPVHHGTLVHGIQYTCITYKQYCQIYAHVMRVPAIVTPPPPLGDCCYNSQDTCRLA